MYITVKTLGYQCYKSKMFVLVPFSTAWLIKLCMVSLSIFRYKKVKNPEISAINL